MICTMSAASRTRSIVSSLIMRSLEHGDRHAVATLVPRTEPKLAHSAVGLEHLRHSLAQYTGALPVNDAQLLELGAHGAVERRQQHGVDLIGAHPAKIDLARCLHLGKVAADRYHHLGSWILARRAAQRGKLHRHLHRTNADDALFAAHIEKASQASAERVDLHHIALSERGRRHAAILTNLFRFDNRESIGLFLSQRLDRVLDLRARIEKEAPCLLSRALLLRSFRLAHRPFARFDRFAACIEVLAIERRPALAFGELRLTTLDLGEQHREVALLPGY